MKRLSPDELDKIGERLETITLEASILREQVKEQVDHFGSIPPRAEKSRRLETEQFQFTLSSSSRTEIKDAEVERIRQACPESVFSQLFATVTKYKLVRNASLLLAVKLPEGAPRNLRMMFSAAVQLVEDPPRLTIKRLVGEEVESA